MQLQVKGKATDGLMYVMASPDLDGRILSRLQLHEDSQRFWKWCCEIRDVEAINAFLSLTNCASCTSLLFNIQFPPRGNCNHDLQPTQTSALYPDISPPVDLITLMSSPCILNSRWHSIRHSLDFNRG